MNRILIAFALICCAGLSTAEPLLDRGRLVLEVGGIRFHRASNVTFRGATIDYDPLPFTQGTVIRIDKSTFDVEIHNGYKSVTGHQRVIGGVFRLV